MCALSPHSRKSRRVKRIDEQIVVGVPAKVLQQIGSGGDKYIHPEVGQLRISREWIISVLSPSRFRTSRF